MAQSPQSVDAKIESQSAAAIADILNLKAILSTPQLTKADVEQPAVKLELPDTGKPDRKKNFSLRLYINLLILGMYN